MNERALDEVIALLGSRTGMAFGGPMRQRLARSLTSLADDAGLPSETYAAGLLLEASRLQRLIDEVTLPESSFFRDPDQFLALAHHVLPHLSAPIRIWSAGCARGQEPYSLAMLLLEGGYTGASVVATDISTNALARARAGRYPETALRGLSPERRQRWFIQDGDGWRVNGAVRQRIVFDRHNLGAGPPPFPPGQCQVIFCRNVLIYFRPEALLAALERMLAWLPAGGLLFLGHSESLWQVTDIFDLVRLGDAFVYRKPGRHIVPEPEEPPASAPDVLWTATDEPAALPPVESLLRTGQHAMALRDLPAAAAAFRQAAYLDKTHPLAHLQLGLVLEAQGDAASAVRAFRAARTALRRLDPDSASGTLPGYRAEVLARLVEAKIGRDE